MTPLRRILIAFIPILFSGFVFAQTCVPTVSITGGSVITVCKGNPVTLAVTSTNGGTSPLYQWKLNGVNSITTPTYTIPNPVTGSTVVILFTSSDTCAGSVTVSDTVTISVSDITANASATNATCGNNDGTVSITGISGGTPPYTFSLDNGTAQSDSTITGVPGGVHYFLVRDAAGCQYFSIVTVPITGSITGVNASSVNEVCGLGNGSVTISGVTGGTAPYIFRIVETGATQTTSTFPITFSGLPAGLYSMSVKGADSCEFIFKIVYVDVSGEITQVPVTSTPATCANNDGTILVDSANIQGGTKPFTYSRNGGSSYQTSPSFTGLAAGSYTIVVKDANGCTATATATVASPPLPSPTYTTTNANCENPLGYIKVTGASGGTAPYSYKLNAADYGTTPPDGLYPIGIYVITVTDQNNCESKTSVLVSDDCEFIPIQIPDVVSPNSDGLNDKWEITNIDRYPVNEVFIFDRWGQRVYHKKGYKNSEGWEGQYGGSPLPEATYYYIIDLNVNNKEGKPAKSKGYVQLIR